MGRNDYLSLLVVGERYDRPELSRIWGLVGHQAISRGVFTPVRTNLIFLFVTREKQKCQTQFKDFLDGDLLFWEGESLHGSDNRIELASSRGEDVHLFYRERHHDPFVFYGKVVLAKCIHNTDRPSEFVFKVAALAYQTAEIQPFKAADARVDYQIVSAQGLNGIDKSILAKSRGIAQHIFRGNQLKMWDGSCAVTGVCDARVLRASHIKPWAKATVDEKLDRYNGLLLIPDLDVLFEEGLVTFQDDGLMEISSSFEPQDRINMRVSSAFRLRSVPSGTKPYLEYHREHRFVKAG